MSSHELTGVQSNTTSDLLVGCIPNADDFKHPADRRRYLYYLKNKGIAYEHAEFNKSYSVLYLAINADLSKWAEYKGKELQKGNHVRVIFDLSDSYMTDSWLKDRLRSVYHFISGQASKLRLSYKASLLKMIQNTDVLLCASDEQKIFLDAYHPNVIVAKDYFEDDIKQAKVNYELTTPGEINILWEGFSHGNLKIFEMLRQIIDNLGSFKIKLHFITDPEYCKIGTSYLCKPTYTILKDIFSDSLASIHVYDWNPVTFSSIAATCDLALIPIPDDPIMMRKPENKMILLWSLGIPVVSTNTASYSRVMKDANEVFVCDTMDDWKSRITELASSKERRESYMKNVKNYLHKYASAEVLLSIWDKVFFEALRGI